MLAWSLFLAPILDGVYRRQGHLFQLRPAVWIFAGTELPSSQGAEQKSAKASDFATRINGPVIDLTAARLDDERAAERLENIYLAMALARRRFPDLFLVEPRVLTFFQTLRPKFGTRSLEHVLNSLRNVQHGALRFLNLPHEWATIERWCWWERTLEEAIRAAGPKEIRNIPTRELNEILRHTSESEHAECVLSFVDEETARQRAQYDGWRRSIGGRRVPPTIRLFATPPASPPTQGDVGAGGNVGNSGDSSPS